MWEEVVEVRQGANAVIQGPVYEQTIVSMVLIFADIGRLTRHPGSSSSFGH
jgi:hypothetical protein